MAPRQHAPFSRHSPPRIRYAVLFNPYAGAAKKQQLTQETLAKQFHAQQMVVEFLPHHPEESQIQQAVHAGYTLLAVGGDGTVQTALQALRRHLPQRIGIIPAGTSNHFSQILGIPQPREQALAVIAAGFTRRIDLGCVNDTIFLQAAGVGFHAAIFEAYGETTEKSHVKGTLAALSTFLRWTPHWVTVSLDGARFCEEVTLVTAANTHLYGGEFYLAPHAKLDDGLLDVVILKKVTKPELIRYAAAIVRGTHLSLPKISLVRARRLEVTARGEKQLPVHADGRPIGSTPATIEVLPGSLEVFVPEQSLG